MVPSVIPTTAGTIAVPDPEASASRPPAWQGELATGCRRPGDLRRQLGLALGDEAGDDQPMLVPAAFIARMRPGDPADPLLRQVLPDAAERTVVPGWGRDPLAEEGFAIAPGVIARYPRRVLVQVTDACAVRCRFCFRRHRPGSVAARAPTLRLLAGRPDLTEVILSGGDPLVLDDRELGAWFDGLDALPGRRRLRIHSRVPVVLPARVDRDLTRLLAAVVRPLVLVLHANHPRELDAAVGDACRRLRGAGVVLLAQTVLLAGVNDEVGTLTDLAESLGDLGVVPYYLHCLDRVAGAAHFAIADDRARELAAALAARLPGHLVPRLVRDQPGQPAKVPPA